MRFSSASRQSKGESSPLLSREFVAQDADRARRVHLAVGVDRGHAHACAQAIRGRRGVRVHEAFDRGDRLRPVARVGVEVDERGQHREVAGREVDRFAIQLGGLGVA